MLWVPKSGRNRAERDGPRQETYLDDMVAGDR
jgi:hypothetical protein